MADSIEIASAYVSLTTKMPGVKKDVEASLGEAEGASEAAGARSGAKFGAALAAGIVAAAVVVAASVAGLYKAGDVFDDVSDTIRIGTGASGDALEGLIDVANRVGATVPAQFGKIGSTVADLNTRLGLSGDTLQTVASQYLEAGRLLKEDVDIQATTGAFNAFQIKGEDVSAALDTLFRVSQATGLGINQLASTVQTSAPLVQNLGFSFADTAALVGSLDKAGLDANKMLATLGPGLVNMAKDGEQPAEVFPRIISQLQAFVDAGDVASAIDLAGGIFGTRGAAQFVGALQSGVVNLDDLTAAAGLTQDTILGLAAETSDAAEGWQVFKNNALLAIQPVANAVFGLAGGGMAKLVEWAQANGPAIAGFFSQLGVVFGPLIDQALQLWTQMSPLSILFKTLQPILPVLLSAFAPLGPILAQLAELVGGLVAQIVPLVASIVAQLLPAILPLIGIFLEIAAAILPILSSLLPPLIDLLGVVLTPIIDILSVTLMALAPIFDLVGASITIVSGILQILAEIFGGVVKTVMALMKGDLSSIPGIWSGIWDKVVAIVRDAWGGVIDFAESGVNGLIDLINGLIGGINKGLSSVGLPTMALVGHVNWQGAKFADGAFVSAGHGGVLAQIGEGRYSEVVQPIGGPKFDQFVDSIASKLNTGDGVDSDKPTRLAREDLDYLVRELAALLRLQSHQGGASHG